MPNLQCVVGVDLVPLVSRPSLLPSAKSPRRASRWRGRMGARDGPGVHTPVGGWTKACCEPQGLSARQMGFQLAGQPVPETDTPAWRAAEGEDWAGVSQLQAEGVYWRGNPAALQSPAPCEPLSLGRCTVVLPQPDPTELPLPFHPPPAPLSTSGPWCRRGALRFLTKWPMACFEWHQLEAGRGSTGSETVPLSPRRPCSLSSHLPISVSCLALTA